MTLKGRVITVLADCVGRPNRKLLDPSWRKNRTKGIKLTLTSPVPENRRFYETFTICFFIGCLKILIVLVQVKNLSLRKKWSNGVCASWIRTRCFVSAMYVSVGPSGDAIVLWTAQSRNWVILAVIRSNPWRKRRWKSAELDSVWFLLTSDDYISDPIILKLRTQNYPETWQTCPLWFSYPFNIARLANLLCNWSDVDCVARTRAIARKRDFFSLM